jgi:hypothetical protein
MKEDKMESRSKFQKERQEVLRTPLSTACDNEIRAEVVVVVVVVDGSTYRKEVGQKFSTTHCSNCTEDACIFLPPILTFNYIVSTQYKNFRDRWIPKGAE